MIVSGRGSQTWELSVSPGGLFEMRTDSLAGSQAYRESPGGGPRSCFPGAREARPDPAPCGGSQVRRAVGSAVTPRAGCSSELLPEARVLPSPRGSVQGRPRVRAGGECGEGRAS